MLDELSIYITVKQGLLVGLTYDGKLCMHKVNLGKKSKFIKLGKFTKGQMKDLAEYIERLSIHCPDKLEEKE
jgi:hypothetical protein